MRKVGLIFFGVFLLIFSSLSVFAADEVTITHTETKSTILQHQTAVFYVTITNHQDVKDTFRIVKPSVFWNWLLDLEENNIELQGGESKTIMVELTPFSNFNPGDYGVTLDVTSNTNSNIKDNELLDIKVVTYDTTIITRVNTDEVINPNQENLFRIDIINNYDLLLEDVKFTLESDYFKIERDIDLRPFEEITLEVPVEFSGVVRDGPNDLYLKFEHENKQVVNRRDNMNIGYYTDVSVVGKPEKGLLYTKETILRTNEGLTVSKENFEKQVSSFEKLFTSVSPEPTEIIKVEEGYKYVWIFDLNPGESKTISVKTDYRLFTLIVALLIIGGAYLYYRLGRDLSLDKRVISMKKTEDGHFTMNIMMSLKNKTLKDIYNIKIMDSLSGVVEKVYGFNVLEPTIFKESNGRATKLVWNIPVLGKREKITVMYSIKYKPSVIKSVPFAFAKYLRHGRFVMVRSNNSDIFKK